MPIQLESKRLILRPWQETDRLPFYQLNADPAVMRYFPKCLSRTESDQLLDKFQALIELQGWGFWAVELKTEQRLIGMTGLHHQPDQFSFSPCTEIGWRFDKNYWGQGYATEAAQLALNFAFQTLQLNEVVAFTAAINHASVAVMQRLGMLYRQEFLHPALTADSILQKHVLYAIQQAEFCSNMCIA